MASMVSLSDSSSSRTPTEIISHGTRREIERQYRLSRTSLDRHSKGELATLLAREEREASKLRRMLLAVTEQLRVETTRADDNERRARDAAVRFREIDDARAKAQKDAKRANEELRLYKLQLDAAQKEIFRAQSILDTLDGERVQAEASAARARSTARKMKEELLVEQAREEGRRLGVQEAMSNRHWLPRSPAFLGDPSQGRSRALRYPDTLEGELYGDTPEPPPPPPPGVAPAPPPSPPPPPPAPAPAPAPETPPAPAPAPDPALPAQPDEIHPVIVHNVPPSPSQVEFVIPPDGFVPVASGDLSIHLPPPHEMQRPIPSPTQSLSALPLFQPQVPSTPPLPIPNPGNRRDNDRSGDAFGSQRGHRGHRRRESSPESLASTTISEFAIVTEPGSAGPASARPYSNMNKRSLSVIPESVSSATTPARKERSLRDSPAMSDRVRNLPPMSEMTSPRIVTTAPEQEIIPDPPRYVYKRPSFASSSGSDVSPARTPASARRSLRVRESSTSVPDINVEPPSRPSSQTPQGTPTAMTRDFLTPEDAHRIQTPTQPKSPELPAVSLVQTPGPGPGGMEPIVITGDLPPGFMPTSPIQPIQSILSPSHVSANLPPVFPSGAPMPHPGAPGPMPGSVPVTSSSSTSRKSHKSQRSVPVARAPSSAGSRTSAVVPDASLYRGAPVDSSTSDTDDALSSSIASSRDTLSTPPPEKIKPKKRVARRPAYEAAPGDVQYPTSPLMRVATMGSSTPGTARVPLPPSSLGATSPRANPSYLSASTEPQTLSAVAGQMQGLKGVQPRGKPKKKK